MTVPDPDGLRPEDFPGWYRGPDPSQVGKWGHGHSRAMARNISFHCGDIFTCWVLAMCAKREDPWALLRAADAVLEMDNGGGPPASRLGGHRGRPLVAKLFEPDRWDEQQMEGRWPF